MHDVIASGRHTTFFISLVDFKMLVRSMKKLHYLSIFLDVTTKTSISELGELTPSWYDPNGKILNPQLETSKLQFIFLPKTNIHFSII